MFLCEKKIAYLSVYEYGDKIASAGFVKIVGEREGFLLSMQVKNTGAGINGKYPLYLLLEHDRIGLGNLTVTSGRGEYERSFYVYQGKAVVGDKSFAPEEVCGIMLELTPEKKVEGRWSRAGRKVSEARKDPLEEKVNQEKSMQGNTAEETKHTGNSGTGNETVMGELTQAQGNESVPVQLEEIYSGDKWEQLLRQYKNVHPFGDDRLYVAIEPKDFIVLSAPCQKLVNNSFLLHGFYNYRHIILGKDHEIGNEWETCFYIGVPGVYFEREKMVAVMFGFEGFECTGPVEIGKFGYYLRRVEL